MALRLFQRPATCAVCRNPLGERGVEAHGRRFHSGLCLRRYEKNASRGERSRKKQGGGGCGGCH